MLLPRKEVDTVFCAGRAKEMIICWSRRETTLCQYWVALLDVRVTHCSLWYCSPWKLYHYGIRYWKNVWRCVTFRLTSHTFWHRRLWQCQIYLTLFIEKLGSTSRPEAKLNDRCGSVDVWLNWVIFTFTLNARRFWDKNDLNKETTVKSERSQMSLFVTSTYMYISLFYISDTMNLSSGIPSTRY